MLKVLVAPLDWGLGHATRCVPIIKELIDQGCTVIIAAAAAQKLILQEEFPELSFVEMPGFRVKYGKNRAFTLLKIIFAIPKILIGIKRESQWLRRFAGQEGLDLVISDNRYGLGGAGVFSVFITHQLAIRTSFGFLADALLQRMNYGFIRRFSVCWVPDVSGTDNLAGKLSHPSRMPPRVAVRYIGWLSRLRPEAGREEYDLLVLLSGPEPQRTLLEAMVLGQLTADMGRVVMVRGLPKGGEQLKAPDGVTVFDYLSAQELGDIICRSKVVLARSGYSTVMDLVRLRRRAVYIPTPGQPEQEYLAVHLEQQGLGLRIRQQGFSLPAALQVALALGLGDAGPGGAGNGVPGDDNGLLAREVERVLAIVRGEKAGSVRGDQSAVADLG
jgi:UDP-N-acetylglucosamine transferase subunit ALG13